MIRLVVVGAENADVQHIVGHHRRHNPIVQQVRSVVQSGSLGKLVAVSDLWTLRKPYDYFEITWRRSQPGGGPTLSNLIHEIDNLRFIKWPGCSLFFGCCSYNTGLS